VFMRTKEGGEGEYRSLCAEEIIAGRCHMSLS
jgi:hypothetical protein